MSNPWQRFKTRHVSEPFWCELASGCAILTWGLYSSFIGLSLDALPAYDVLTEYIPDTAWCWISIICGSIQISAALFELRRLRRAIAFIMLILWKVLAVALLKSGVTAPASMVYCVLAIGNIPTFWMLRRP